MSNIVPVTDRRMEINCDTEHSEHGAECDSMWRTSHRVIAMCPYGCDSPGSHSW
jgi:hypothetical protein